MTDTDLRPQEGNPCVVLRKRLRFRSWHRGTKEIDLLLGTFADQWLEAFDEGTLSRYEALLANSDPDLYAWIVGDEAAPDDVDAELIRLLKKVKTRAVST